MSDGYWQHDGYRVPRGAGDFAAVPPSPPDAASSHGEASSATRGYWQGKWQPPEKAEPLHREGSVSARARQAYAAEALRRKDHVVAGLLAIFLGIFGVHKFYLGCNQAGFTMMAVSIIGGILTFGLAAAVIGVIALIEGVIYLTKSQTEFDQAYVLCQRDWF